MTQSVTSSHISKVESSTTEPASERLQGIRILVVDDSEINLELAQLLLETEGATIHLAENGQEALSWLEAHPDDIDLILMDIQMPVMDGYTATQLIRQRSQWTHLPIIALSAGVLKEEQDRAISSGMNHFIAKPFNIDELVVLIQKLIHQSKNPPDSTTLPPTTTVEDLDSPIIEWSVGLKQWGKEAVYRNYLNKFIERYQNAGHDLTVSLNQGDIQAAQELSHKLKGVAGTLALKTVALQASELNTAFKNGIVDLKAVDTLQKSIEQTCQAIATWETSLH